MAQNYDAVQNRLRLFRFINGNDLESLRQERVQDALDAYEFGSYYIAKRNRLLGDLLATLFVQPFHFLFVKTQFFKSYHPFFRVTFKASLSIGLYMALRYRSSVYLNDMLEEMYIAKTVKSYENPLMVTHGVLKDLVRA